MRPRPSSSISSLAALPQTGYAWDAPPPAVEQPDGFPHVTYTSASVEMVDHYLRNTIEAVVLLCDAPAVPVCQINCPANLTLDEFNAFVAKAGGVQYDPGAAAMTIYKKGSAEDRPDSTPIREYPNYGLAFEFSTNVTSDNSVQDLGAGHAGILIKMVSALYFDGFTLLPRFSTNPICFV
jgi:hypothetical protein